MSVDGIIVPCNFLKSESYNDFIGCEWNVQIKHWTLSQKKTKRNCMERVVEF